MTSPRDGLRCHQTMDCDIRERCIVTRRPSLLIFGRRVSPSRLVPALQLSEFARSGALSEAFGAGVVLGELFLVALSVRPQSRRRIFSGPARFRQPEHPGGALAAAEVSWVGKPQGGELGGFPSGGTWAFLPLLPRTANDPGRSSFSGATATAAAPVRGSSSASPAAPSPPQHLESMATQLEDRCAICLGSWEEASFGMPCLPRSCCPCILRWAESKPECPPCQTSSSTLHVSLGRTASRAEEAMAESGSAARAGGVSQPPQAGPAEAAADSQCPICLGDIKKAAYVAFCLHCFCFACIRQWARRTAACPVCRQPFEQLLHSVRGDDDYEEYVVGLPPRLRRRMAMERARSRSPQRRYNLRRRPTTSRPAAGRSGPGGPDSAQRQGAAPGPSNATSHQAPAPSASREPTPTSAGERPAGPAAPPDPRNGTV